MTKKWIWWFCVFYIVALLPMMFLRDYTPANELRYLSIADEALANGNLFAFTNHGIPYADKPPLYIWWVMLCRTIAGQHCMPLLSLMTLVPACVIFFVMNRWMSPYMSESSRRASMLTLATCEMFIGAVAVLRMDMLMCMFIILALRAFWLRHSDPEKHGRQKWLFPIWIFLGVFTKGPLAFLFPLAGTLVYLVIISDLRHFFRYWCWSTWLVLLGLCAAWFGAVYADGGSEYLDNLLFHQTVGRAVDAFHHKRPFYYYLKSIWYCLAPWSLFLAALLIYAARKRAYSRRNPSLFLITTALTILVMLSCISSKVDIYMLPAIPLLAYAAGFFMERYGQMAFMRWMIAIPALIFILALPAVCAAPAFMDFPMSPFFYVMAAVLCAGGIKCLKCLFEKQKATAALHSSENGIRAIALSLLLGVFVGSWGIPEVNATLGYGMMCRRVTELSEKYPDAEIMVFGIKRPENMDVYLDRPFTILDDTVPVPSADRPVILMTTRRRAADFSAVHCDTVGPNAVLILR